MAIPRISYKPPTAEEEASTWSGATPAGPAQVYLPPAPAPRPAPRPVTRTTSTPTRTVSSGGSGGSGGTGGSGGGGSSEPKKSADKAQVNALETLLNSGFKQALDQRLANIQQAQDTSDAVLLGGYNSRHKRLSELDDDNDKAEGAASWQNVSNRAREASDILAQAATMGAGETDQLNSQLIAARNWFANQAEVNRAYYDTAGSIRTSFNDLVNDTRSARINLSTQMRNDQEQAWATYSNQMAEAATQLGNIRANPYSDSYSADAAKSYWDKMVTTASSAWKNPGVPSEIKDWQGIADDRKVQLNNSVLGGGRAIVEKKPEGFNVGTGTSAIDEGTNLAAEAPKLRSW